MKDENYILLKVRGSWIEREQTKGLIAMHFPDFVEVVREGIITVQAKQAIPKEFVYKHKDINLMEETKKRISIDLGRYLLDNDLIQFSEKVEEYVVNIIGSTLVILSSI